MSRRTPRGPLTPKQRPPRTQYRLDNTTWAMRVIVILAVAIVVTGIVYAAVNGVLFRTTGSPLNRRPMERAFFERPAVDVAPLLLGAVLTHTTEAGTVAVRLTEVEAYEGVGEDPGSHAHRGPTPRTRTMFGPAGHLYAYFTYGMHTCANLTCLPAGMAAAVLVRAGEVVAGEALATERRGGVERVRLARGPANLASALGIALAEDGADLLTHAAFSIEPPAGSAPITSGPRVGVSGEGGSARYPWRFWISGDPTVSAYRAAQPRSPAG